MLYSYTLKSSESSLPNYFTVQSYFQSAKGGLTPPLLVGTICKQQWQSRVHVLPLPVLSLSSLDNTTLLDTAVSSSRLSIEISAWKGLAPPNV